MKKYIRYVTRCCWCARRFGAGLGWFGDYAACSARVCAFIDVYESNASSLHGYRVLVPRIKAWRPNLFLAFLKTHFRILNKNAKHRATIVPIDRVISPFMADTLNDVLLLQNVPCTQTRSTFLFFFFAVELRLRAEARAEAPPKLERKNTAERFNSYSIEGTNHHQLLASHSTDQSTLLIVCIVLRIM